MSLSRKIAAAVEGRPAAGALPCAVVVEDGPHRLELELTAAGPVGLAFDRLAFSAAARPELSTEALRGWAERLASRLTYLMEPLIVLEVDAVAGEAELRSKSPTDREGMKAFYEVRLGRDSTLRMGRVVYDEARRRRRPGACQLTVEVLARLTDDLVASLP